MKQSYEEKINKAFEQYGINETASNLSARQQIVFIASQYQSSDLLGPARLADETFEEYKFRQKIERTWLDVTKQGKVAWVSKDLQYHESIGGYINNGGGTYTKSRHGELTLE